MQWSKPNGIERQMHSMSGCRHLIDCFAQTLVNLDTSRPVYRLPPLCRQLRPLMFLSYHLLRLLSARRPRHTHTKAAGLALSHFWQPLLVQQRCCSLTDLLLLGSQLLLSLVCPCL